VLKRQALLDGIGSLVTMVFLIGFLWAMLVVWRKCRPKIAEALGGDPLDVSNYVVIGVVLIVGLMLIGNQLYWAITDFTNPEYFAWREIRR
jgi:hypothetical protein